MLNGQDKPEERHLPLATMARLRSGRLDIEEIRGLVLPHLASRCEGCREVDEQLARLRREVGHWDDVVAVTEAGAVPDLWRRLEPLPYLDQLGAVEADETLQTWALCRYLQRRSREAARERPRSAAQLANLALALSAHLGEAYDPDWVRDLRALCFACLGNARRALGELHGATDAFDAAALLRPGSPGHSALEAESLVLEALLRRDQHRLGEAIALLDRAYAIYSGARPGVADPEAADRHLAGEALAHQAWCLYHLGRIEPALARLEEARHLVDEARDPRLAFAIRHGQIWGAIALGRFGDAELLLPAAHGLLERSAATARRGATAPPASAERPGGGVESLWLRRAEARLDLALGETGPAEQALREVAGELLELDRGVDAALAFLDLAALYLQQSAAEALRRLAPEILPVFSSPEVHRPQIYALLLVQHACEDQRLTPELARQLAAMLERERRPSLDWWSGSGTVLPEASDAQAVA
jgi:tetratricopeptide (TPR) repeat protein